MLRTKTHLKAAAILLAVLMVVGTLLTPMPPVSAANEGTLNIHKLSQTAVTDANMDAAKTYYPKAIDENYEYLAGARYTVYKIGIFAETNVGGTISTVYTPVSSLVMMTGKTLGSATVPADIDLTASLAGGLNGTETAVTTATGALSITSGLDKDGVYLIVESTLPSGVSEGADFIITVPMYNATTETWEYTVDAYPKNVTTSGAIEKTMTAVNGTSVTPGASNTVYGNVGDKVTYSVDVTIPNDYTVTNTESAKNYTKFNIIDSSSPYLKLQYTSNPADGVTVSGSTSGAFTAGTDYTATYVPGTGGANNALTVTFTAEGLAKIQADETLTITYDTEILAGAVASATGVTNSARIDFIKGTGSGTITPSPTDPVPTVKIYSYGVKKMDDGTTPAPLAGASFKLATKDGSRYEYLSFNTTTGKWEVVAEAAAPVFTTTTSTGAAAAIGDEAILQFKNLDPTVTYYLIETEAPTNYIKLLNPVEIIVTSATTDTVYNTYNATTGAYVPDTGYTVKITNVHKDNGGIIGGGGLPTTGGNGIYLYLIIGAVLMGTAVVFFIGRNRKKIKQYSKARKK